MGIVHYAWAYTKAPKWMTRHAGVMARPASHPAPDKPVIQHGLQVSVKRKKVNRLAFVGFPPIGPYATIIGCFDSPEAAQAAVDKWLSQNGSGA